MIHRELTFLPEVERTRDLHYSEYTSRERSLHILFQDNSIPQYRFLLEAYREIIAQYQSVHRLRSPVEWLRDIVARLDVLSRRLAFSVSDFKAVGFYVVLRSRGTAYLLTSREDEIFVYERGELQPIGGGAVEGVERMDLEPRDAQQELFPQRVRHSFLLFKLEASAFADRELVIGCGEEDKSTVLDVLSRPMWHGEQRERNTVSSKFITRKLMTIGFEPVVFTSTASTAARTGIGAVAPQWTRRASVLAAASVVFLVLVGLWAGDVFMSPDGTGSPAVRSTVADAPATEPGAEIQPEPVEEVAEPPEEPAVPDIRLAESWKKTYEEPVTSSPAQFRDWVIFGCRDGNLYALDKGTGAGLWSFTTESGVGASPVVSGERVFAADYAGNVFGINALSGEKIWVHKLPAKVVSSPSVLEDKLLVGCYDGYAYCLAAADGTILWKKKTAGRIRASSEAADGTFFVPSYDGFLYALDAGTGEVRWRYKVGGQLAGGPLAHAGSVAIGGVDGSVYLLDAADGSLRWKFKTGDAVKSRATVSGGRLYVGSNDMYLYCLNLADGSLVWKHKTEDVVLSRACVAEGTVFVGSYDGIVYALDAASGELRDQLDTNGAIYSTPFIDGGHMYFGNNRGDFICVAYDSKGAS